MVQMPAAFLEISALLFRHGPLQSGRTLRIQEFRKAQEAALMS